MLAKTATVRMFTTAPVCRVRAVANARAAWSIQKKVDVEVPLKRRRRSVEHTAKIQDTGHY